MVKDFASGGANEICLARPLQTRANYGHERSVFHGGKRKMTKTRRIDRIVSCVALLFLRLGGRMTLARENGRKAFTRLRSVKR